MIIRQNDKVKLNKKQSFIIALLLLLFVTTNAFAQQTIVGESEEKTFLLLPESKESVKTEKVSPHIAILDYDPQATYPKRIQLRMRAYDMSGIFKVFVQGEEVTNAGNYFYTKELVLKGGANVVKVRAIDKHGNVSEKKITFNCDMEMSANRGCHDYLLVFVTNKFKDSYKSLDKSKEQALGIARVLENEYKFKAKVVENPSLDTIRATLEDYYQKFANKTMESYGQLLVLMTSHVEFVDENSFFLVTNGTKKSDISGSALPFIDLREAINSMPVRQGLLLLDAYHSPQQIKGLPFGSKNNANSKGEPILNKLEMNISSRTRLRYRRFITSYVSNEYSSTSSWTLDKLYNALTANDKVVLKLQDIWEKYLVMEENAKTNNLSFTRSRKDVSFIFVRKRK